MKEAAGEANMTVITIVLIAIVLAVGTLIVNQMMSSSKKSSCCTSNGGVWYNGACYLSSQCTTDSKNKTTCSGKAGGDSTCK